MSDAYIKECSNCASFQAGDSANLTYRRFKERNPALAVFNADFHAGHIGLCIYPADAKTGIDIVRRTYYCGSWAPLIDDDKIK